MARLTLSIFASLVIYFAYHTLASEALSASAISSSSSTSSSNNLKSSRNSESMESLLGRDDVLNKLQSAWFRNAYNLRPVGPALGATGHIGTYSVLRRSFAPAPAMGPKLPQLTYDPPEINFIGDEDVDKRFDDYGHMRFGKRGGGGGGEGEQFDDYGHMRFGRR